MARALTSKRTVVTPAERDRYLERAARRREHFTRAGCRYWVFEETDLAGAFIEFIEGPAVPALESALAAAPDPFLEQLRIYEEVELA